MEKTRPKTTRDAKPKQNVQQFQDFQPVDVQQGFYDADDMSGVSNLPVMPIRAVVPMPFDPFCPQFSPEEALQKGTLFKWLYSPYVPCAPKPRRKCTC